MSDTERSPRSRSPQTTSLDRLLAGRPAPLDVEDNLELVRSGRRLVVLDDDPTGTQCIVDLPVLTSWTVPDLRWALQQPTVGFFVLTNTRSLGSAAAADRNRKIVAALDEAARAEGARYVIDSRSDSTLRGHYPLETDVLGDELAAHGESVDGVVLCPAYIEPGRVTVDSIHFARVGQRMVPVADSEFARDASFGYHSSDLRDWVAEKTKGRIGREDVATITLDDIRVGGPAKVRDILAGLHGGQPVVVDAACDADLQVVTRALLVAEAAGGTFLYRTGPSMVRARAGQRATPAIDTGRLRTIIAGHPPDPTDARSGTPHGLIVVGSHVGLSTRQLERLRGTGHVFELELDVPGLLDPETRPARIEAVVGEAIRLLQSTDHDNDVVVRTSRKLVTGRDPEDSLTVARQVSTAVVDTVRGIVGEIRPGFVVAKGGITSSDIATDALLITRAWSRGTLLPGIVSLWEPVSGPGQGVPYVVFAGNVGNDQALADVVSLLRSR